MKYSAGQHLKIAALLDGKASAAADPERQKRLSEFAKVHRTLARKAAEQSQKSTGRDEDIVGDAGTDGARAGKAKPTEPEFPFADDATYQRALPLFKAGAVHFADERNDIKEMIRGLVRHLNKAGMSPEAIRDMKPYIVRFVEDIRSGKESLDGIPLPENGGDAGSEPEDVPPGAGQHGMEYSVPNSLPYILTEDPDPFDTVENLERHLAELQAMPAYQNKASHIIRLKGVIAIKKRHGAERKAMTKEQAANSDACPGSFDNSIGDILRTRVMGSRPGGDHVDFTTGGILEQAIEPRAFVAAAELARAA